MFPFMSPFDNAGMRRADGAGGFMPRNTRGQNGPAEMQDMFSMIFQTMQQGGLMNNRPVAGFGNVGFGGQIRGGTAQGPSPFDILGALFSPNGRAGDAVFSQQAFDQILEQLAEQNGAHQGPGPASENAIRSLPTKKVTQEMMGHDGTAECSICMDNVEIGSDVTELPCKHWFHRDCVVAWLKEHDTCPHCRKPTTSPDEQQQQPGARRRSSRQSSARGPHFGGDGSRDRPYNVPESPGGLRDARAAYYEEPPRRYQEGPPRPYQDNGRSAYAEATEQPYMPGQYPSQRPPSRPRRHSSGQSGRHSHSRQSSDRGQTGGAGGGVTGWLRNHMGMG
jgi:E3 ubiquitin-protein ligase RNF115/126